MSGGSSPGGRFSAVGVCAIVSFRLGLTDGVSVVADLWGAALRQLGWTTITVAGEGPVDHVVPGLAIGARQAPDRADLQAILADADVVVVENLLSIPMNLEASRAVADVLRGRPAVLHHHDPPWQRERFAHITELPPDDDRWRHVTINRLTERQFADRGLTATTIYNGFDPDPPPGDRANTRDWLDLNSDDILVAHPVRAIARKNIPAAVALTEALGGVYWLPGPAEEGYEDELATILDRARCPVLRQPLDYPHHTIHDLYAACDLVAFPSLWEGFGNPPIEAALHRRPAAVGSYPVADELRRLGFRWFAPDDTDTIAAALRDNPTDLLDRNHELARQHLSVATMTDEIERLFETSGWTP
jgi:glycosyltransferase involved in cell wall biosynthesis